MLNQETRTVTMSRSDMCRIATALTRVPGAVKCGSAFGLSLSPSWTRRIPKSFAASNHHPAPEVTREKEDIMHTR